MNREDYTDETYAQPHVPPATPPVIDGRADPHEAAELAFDNGDSDQPGAHEASVNRGNEDAALFDGGAARGGDQLNPGEGPDEIDPGQGDTDAPGQRPDEIDPGQGDFDRPGRAPAEMPPQPGKTPGETPPPD